MERKKARRTPLLPCGLPLFLGCSLNRPELNSGLFHEPPRSLGNGFAAQTTRSIYLYSLRTELHIEIRNERKQKVGGDTSWSSVLGIVSSKKTA